jgi:hypothetical protein
MSGRKATFSPFFFVRSSRSTEVQADAGAFVYAGSIEA